MTNKIKKYIIIVISFSLMNKEVKTQDIQLSQNYAAPLHLNPAFTGFNVCARASTIIRNQWPGLPNAYVSEIVSFDHYIVNQNVGVGAMFTNDVAGAGRLRSTSFSGLFAYEAQINRTFGIRAGFQAGIGTRSINFNSLLFGDQLARGGNVPTLETPTSSKAFLDFSSGILFYGDGFWAGLSVHHITQPNESLIDEEGYLPRKFSLQGGYKFLVAGDPDDQEGAAYVLPTLMYKAQAKFDQLDIGFYYLKGKLTLGLWYRGIPGFKAYQKGYPNNDALVFLAGIHHDRFRIGYSYDFTISWLKGKTEGAHEVTISYEFCQLKRKRRRAVLVACPKF